MGTERRRARRPPVLAKWLFGTIAPVRKSEPTLAMTNRRALVCALGVATVAGPRAWAHHGPKYKFTPANQASLTALAAYWNPILDYVSRRSGFHVQLRIGRTAQETVKLVLAGGIDLVFTNQLLTPEGDRLGWRVVARRDTPPVSAQLVTLAHSAISSDSQLEGLPVAFPGPDAVIPYKIPMAHLQRRGIRVQSLFAGNMDAAFARLISRSVAAVGANSQLVTGFSRREGTRFRVLWSSDPLPDLAFMASDRMPRQHQMAIVEALTGMSRDPEGLTILRAVSRAFGLPEATGFVTASGAEYLPYRKYAASR
jgi:phosphonate transport system substrate-binding protein